MSFAAKVKWISIFIVLFPMIIATAVVTYMAQSALYQQAEDSLTAVREIKQQQIGSMLSEFANALEVVTAAVQAMQSISEVERQHDLFQQLNQQLGFYDIFIIQSDGTVAYTVERESDYRSNLRHGPYSNSGLARLMQRTQQQAGQIVLEDFSPYAPSGNEAAAFLGRQLQLADGMVTVAVQLSIEKINQVMQVREGMGQSGETYLVGSDLRMRSDSFLDPVKRSVQASFAGTIANNGADTAVVRQALAGQQGVQPVIDYNGNWVVSAYAPLDVFGVRWALLAEIDRAEVLAPARRMLWIGVVICLAAIGLAFAAAQLVCRFVLEPLGGEPEAMCQLTSVIAAGDLTTPLERRDSDKHLMSWLARMQQSLRQLVQQLVGVGQQLEMTAEQNSAAITQADGSIQLQAKETDMLATAIEQMSYAAAEIGQNTSKALFELQSCKGSSEHLQQNLTSSQLSLKKTLDSFAEIHQEVRALEQDSQKVSQVLDVINTIAEQTNLLALNAAIEAARAGEHGRGFAVVSDEVRQLASKVQEAVQEISAVLHGIQKQSVGLARHSEVCAHESAKTAQDATLMEGSAAEIDQRLATLKELMGQTASAAEEQTTVSATLAEGISRLSASAEENSTAISQVAGSTRDLLGLANQLGRSVAQFKV
ncbi:methyl-accepting chemotaxis protein [Alkalimonas sp. NCh-2]|uniref:methyl-accepting chemotaxis protein n=1 Tax=Alkalimonas sp. NCh-2 TaxID=3144846 RepID=UPI0031F65DFF